MSASSVGSFVQISLRVSGRDEYIERCDSTSAGGSGDTVGEDLVAALLEVGVGEDEANVAYALSMQSRRLPIMVLTLDVGKKALVLRVVANEALQRAAHHCVLAHEHDALAAEGLADLVHLLRRDIVDGDDEDALVVLEEDLELVKVSGLVIFPAPHYVRR
jgi:hypothetical protein